MLNEVLEKLMLVLMLVLGVRLPVNPERVSKTPLEFDIGTFNIRLKVNVLLLQGFIDDAVTLANFQAGQRTYMGAVSPTSPDWTTEVSTVVFIFHEATTGWKHDMLVLRRTVTLS